MGSWDEEYRLKVGVPMSHGKYRFMGGEISSHGEGSCPFLEGEVFHTREKRKKYKTHKYKTR